MKVSVLPLIAAALLGVSCQDQDGKPSATPPKTNNAFRFEGQPPEPTEAQPRLATMKLFLGPQEITAEIARTLPEVTTGMMFRTNMAEMEGMLFVFARPHRASFWMRNTILPLSCAYIDPDGTILEIHDMKPRDETGIPASSDRIQYVLEMKQGWFERNHVSVGAVVKTERGTLGQTFFGR